MSAKPIVPPTGPLLVPDPLTELGTKHLLVAIKRNSTAEAKAKKWKRKNGGRRVTKLLDAFTYDQKRGRDTRDMQKALYSIAYLMDYFSDIGNHDPSGDLVSGLAHSLRDIAQDVGELCVRGGQ